MKVEELENVTASCGSGPKEQKTWHVVMRGKKGKFGTEVVINLTELKKAVAAGARTYEDKKGNKYLSLRPKVWEPREELSDDQWGNVHKAAKGEPEKPRPMGEIIGDSLDDGSDLPF